MAQSFAEIHIKLQNMGAAVEIAVAGVERLRITVEQLPREEVPQEVAPQEASQEDQEDQEFYDPLELEELLTEEEKEELSLVHAENRVIGRKVYIYQSAKQRGTLLAWGILRSTTTHGMRPSAKIDIKWKDMTAIRAISTQPSYVRNLGYAYLSRCVLMPN